MLLNEPWFTQFMIYFSNLVSHKILEALLGNVLGVPIKC